MDALEPYFNNMDEALIRTLRNAPVRDEEGIMLIKMQMDALTRLKINLNSIIDTGKLAEMEKDDE